MKCMNVIRSVFRWIGRTIGISIGYIVLFMMFPIHSQAVSSAWLVEVGETQVRVSVVENEAAMLDKLMEGLQAHEEYIAISYPGIIQDVRGYAPSFDVFLDGLMGRDSYHAGILTDFHVTLYGGEVEYALFQFHYLTTVKQEKRIDRKVRKLAKKLRKGSKATQARRAHDYLVRSVKYDEAYYSHYEALFKGRGVCMSYALAYQRIMQELHIPCVLVKGEDHAWNMVSFGGRWYNVDVTWDDMSGGYRYFLKCDRDFKNHDWPQSPYLDNYPRARKSYIRKAEK